MQPDAIERAWFAEATSLEERVRRTRRSALENGVWSLEGAARAVLVSGESALDRADAAVRLAPDLPAAHMELAQAQWLEGESPLTAIRTATGALLAFERHPEGGLWLAGSLAAVIAAGLAAGGLLCIAVVSLWVAPHAAHDFGDLFSRSLPAFARAALLAAVVLLAAVLGEGPLGLALGLFGVGVVYGGRAERVVLAFAAAAILLGAYPLARLAGATLEALPADPVAQAALATSRGLVLPSDVARLAAAAEDDLLARQARARLARRAGSMGSADALYQSLLQATPEDPVVVNNAANVRLHLGHMEAALELYHRALEIEESPIVLFNLSQAYGRAFQVDDLTVALERAQSLDGDLVADLTRLQGTQPEGFVVDLPIANTTLWSRVFDAGRGEGFAAALRRPLAPGRMGASPLLAAGAFAGVLLAGWLLGLRARPSRWCARCGRRVCPRCHPEVSGGELCGACNRLFYQPEQTDRDLRLARIEALRQRESRLDKIAWAASVALPGAAGILCRRPLRSLLGAVFFALAGAALFWREGVVADPLVAGAAGPFAFACVAALAGLAYAVVVGAALATRRNL
jgi:tetratricopeptide (TPR) repeat protein